MRHKPLGFSHKANGIVGQQVGFYRRNAVAFDAVDLVVRLQQETGKKVNPADFKEIRTLGDVTKAVSKLVNS